MYRSLRDELMFRIVKLPFSLSLVANNEWTVLLSSDVISARGPHLGSACAACCWSFEESMQESMRQPMSPVLKNFNRWSLKISCGQGNDGND
jgi:hypothetical protein